MKIQDIQDLNDFITYFLFYGKFLLLLTAFIIFQIASFKIMKRNALRAHSVAIIGFPRSGKTTLITALFAEIFARRISFVSVTPRGESTIKRINEDIMRLESGQILKSTTDQDLFAYRTELTIGSGFFASKYKFEVGDFPGEDSEKLATQDAVWLNDLPYFQWAMDADAFIFVIDISEIVDDGISAKRIEEYKHRIISEFRASWQKIKDYHYGNKSNVKKKPMVLVFSKFDLLIPHNEMTYKGVMPIRDNYYKYEEAYIKEEYSELIEYFKSECNDFTVAFTSVYTKSKSNNTRTGMEDVLRGVLPK